MVKCWSGSTCIFVCCIYNPPQDSSYRTPIDDFNNLLAFISNSTFDLLFIGGDINFPKTVWGTGYSSDPYEFSIVEKLHELNYSQLVDFRTTKTNTLDVLLTNRPELVDSVAADNKLYQLYPISNHFPVRFEVSIPRTQVKNAPEWTFSYCNCDFSRPESLIIGSPFEPYCYSDINVMVELWYEWIFSLIKECTPIRSQHRRCLPPWVPSATSNRLNRLKTLRRKYARKPTESLRSKLESEENVCKGMEDIDLANYEARLFSTRNSQGIYKYFKSLRGSDLPTVLRWNEIKAFEDYDKAQLLNSYFCSVLNTKGATHWRDTCDPVEKIFPITTEEIITAISSLSVSKSRGPDSVPPIVFIKLKHVLAPSLRNIFKNVPA